VVGQACRDGASPCLGYSDGADQLNGRGYRLLVDHREIFRGYELLPTFNSRAIETMLWRIEGLADRFLYFNDDMMFVGPVEPTDFFSQKGRVTLRGRWSSWSELLEKGNTFNGHNKLLGAEMLGYTSERFFSSGHVIYPMLRPAMVELFEQFKAAFLANAEYRFRNRKQFWPISAHDHLLLTSGRARVVKPSDAAHFSVRLLPQRKSGRPRSATAAARGWHDPYRLHQRSRGGRGQGARCHGLSV
jgi:Stealth protein CR2, conserved region 2